MSNETAGGLDKDAYFEATRREPAMGRGSSMEGEETLDRVVDDPPKSGVDADTLSLRSRLLLGGLG